MVVFFSVLDIGVNHEHPVEIVDGSYFCGLKPKDENLNELFITVFTN